MFNDLRVLQYFRKKHTLKSLGYYRLKGKCASSHMKLDRKKCRLTERWQQKQYQMYLHLLTNTRTLNKQMIDCRKLCLLHKDKSRLISFCKMLLPNNFRHTKKVRN
uniref:Uncharacterized protein n=1 Tax=Rhizophora mucronata TaxID=61149 RepID=A0A2P2QZK8_RHIMU